jgi:hypothetical protein
MNNIIITDFKLADRTGAECGQCGYLFGRLADVCLNCGHCCLLHEVNHE